MLKRWCHPSVIHNCGRSSKPEKLASCTRAICQVNQAICGLGGASNSSGVKSFSASRTISRTRPSASNTSPAASINFLHDSFYGVSVGFDRPVSKVIRLYQLGRISCEEIITTESQRSQSPDQCPINKPSFRVLSASAVQFPTSSSQKR